MNNKILENLKCDLEEWQLHYEKIIKEKDQYIEKMRLELVEKISEIKELRDVKDTNGCAFAIMFVFTIILSAVILLR